MTDKTDPRTDLMRRALVIEYDRGRQDVDGQDATAVLFDLNTADRAAGIVRVDTNDEALMDALADRIGRAAYPDDGQPVTRLGLKAAILAALREAS